MKKYIFIIVSFFMISMPSTSAQLKSEVNECFELVSIAFRLADAPEYVNNEIPNYVSEIDTYFSKYKNHELFPYMKGLREKHGISYDAAMCAAACIKIKNGKVVMLPHCEISKMDSRWTEAAYKTFITYLNDFYRKSNFRTFYVRHSDLYNLAVKKVNQVLGTVNTRWFKSLFGVELGSPLIIVSLTNGRDNYAFTRKVADEKVTGIVVGCVSDSVGMPTCRFDMDYIVVHELLHNYTNPLILQNWDRLSLPAEKIYFSINNELYLGSYDHPQAMTFEWFAKLLSLLYYRDNPQSDKPLKAGIKNMQNQGFIWMERSMICMEHFYKNRNRYPYLKDYMGQIIGFMKYTSDNMEYVLKEYNARAPYIVDTYPVTGSMVTGKVDTIEIRFSEAMLGTYGSIEIKEKGIKELPVKGECLWKDDRTFMIPIDTSRLEQGKYGIRLNPRGFQSLKRYLIKDAYTYTIDIAK